MARQVNKYFIPDLDDIPNTRQGAITAARRVFEANKDAIRASMLEYQMDNPGRMPDPFDFFQGQVLNKLSVQYGGDNEKRQEKIDGKIRPVDVNIDEALNRTLRAWSLTSKREWSKRNFLSALKNSNLKLFNHLRSRMATRSLEHGWYEDIPLDDIWRDDTAAEPTYFVRLANGEILRFTLTNEGNDDESPKWIAYTMSGDYYQYQ